MDPAAVTGPEGSVTIAGRSDRMTRFAAVFRDLPQDSLTPTGGVIMTSRRAEYRAALGDADDVLTGAAVIAPRALSRTKAAAYLRGHLRPSRRQEWAEVLASLSAGSSPGLQELTAAPRGLWLVRTVYIDGGRAPSPLLDHMSSEALRQHLLDELIPAVLGVRQPRRSQRAAEVPMRPGHRYRPEQVERWLTTLAEQATSSESSDRAWWELAGRTFASGRSRWGSWCCS